MGMRAVVAALILSAAAPAVAQDDASDPYVYSEVRSVRDYWGPIMCARWRKGGLISAGKDKLVKVWDTAGRLVRELRAHKEWVLALAVSPDESIVASAGMDGQIILWDPDTGTIRRAISTSGTDFNHARCLSFHPGGRKIACGMREGSVYEFDITTGECTFKARGAERLVHAVAYSPDGKFLAASGHEVFHVWDTATQQLAKTIGKHEKADINSLAWSAGGDLIATGGTDNLVKVWSWKKAGCVGLYRGHTMPVICVAFDHKSEHIVSGDSNGIAYVWDVKSGQKAATLEGHKISVRSADFSKDDSQIVTTSLDSTMRVWNARDGRQVREQVGHGGFIYSIEFTPDGSEIAAAGVEYSVKFWNAKDFKVVRKLAQGWDDTIYRIAFNKDKAGDIAVGHKNGKIKTWGYSNEEMQFEFMAHRGKVWALAHVSGGKYLVSGGEDSYVLVWDTRTRELYKTVGHDAVVRCVAAHPKEPVFASSCEAGLINLWKIGDKKLQWTPKTIEAAAAPVSAVEFSPDGNLLACSTEDGLVRVFDVKTLALVEEHVAHADGALMVTWHPQGKYLASCGKDKTVKIWKLGSEKPVQTLAGYLDEVSCLSYSPDGELLATAAWDGEVKVWRRGNRK